MAPPPTDDFTDCVTDLLTGGSRDDFGSKKYVKAKFKSAEVLSAPVAFTNEVTEKGGKLVGKSSFKWELKQAGITVDKVALDATNGIGALNATVKKTFVPGLQLKCETDPVKKDGSVLAKYTSPTVYAGLLVKAKKATYDSAEADVCVGYDGIQVGAKMTLKSKGLFDDLWLGVSYTMGSYFAAITAEDQLKKFKVSLKGDATKEIVVACEAESDLKTVSGFSTAGSYKVSEECTVKAKYDITKQSVAGHASYSALPKVVMAGGVAIPIADPGSFTYGLGLTLG